MERDIEGHGSTSIWTVVLRARPRTFGSMTRSSTRAGGALITYATRIQAGPELERGAGRPEACLRYIPQVGAHQDKIGSAADRGELPSYD